MRKETEESETNENYITHEESIFWWGSDEGSLEHQWDEQEGEKEMNVKREKQSIPGTCVVCPRSLFISRFEIGFHALYNNIQYKMQNWMEERSFA